MAPRCATASGASSKWPEGVNGTAAGPLVAALVASGKIPAGITAIVEQGYLLGRPSRIQVTVSGQRVRIGGSGLVVADGTLHI